MSNIPNENLNPKLRNVLKGRKEFSKGAIRKTIGLIREEKMQVKDAIRSCAESERDVLKKICDLKKQITSTGKEMADYKLAIGTESRILTELRSRLEKQLGDARKEIKDVSKEAREYKESLKVLDHVITVLNEEFTEGGHLSRMAREFNENQEKENKV